MVEKLVALNSNMDHYPIVKAFMGEYILVSTKYKYKTRDGALTH